MPTPSRRSSLTARVLTAAVLTTLVAAACKSTARDPDSNSRISPEARNQGVPQVGEDTLVDERSARERSAGRDFVAGVGAKASSGGPAGAGQMGPGVTSQTITVGDVYSRDLDEIYSSVGYEDHAFLSPDEYGRGARTLQDAINASGGILGRRLDWRLLYYNESDYTTFEERDRAWCTYFTEELQVLAAFFGSERTMACMEKRGGVSLPGSMNIWDEQLFRSYPHTITPSGISLDRHARLLVGVLHDQGFFERGDRIGLATWGSWGPFDRVVEGVLKPELRRRGLALTAEARIPNLDGLYELPRAEADVRREVLRFKSLDINKVFFLSGPDLPPYFIQSASEWQYRPRFGFSSLSGGFLSRPVELLEGSMAVGWYPTQDLDLQRGLAASDPAALRCRALFDAAGLDFYDGIIRTQQANTMCDRALFLKGALEAGAPSVTADSFIAGAGTLGRSFQSANLLETKHVPGRQWGVASYRHVRWFTDCDCYRYTSPEFAVD